MKYPSTLLFFLLFFGASLSAQSSDAPLLMSTTGEVWYKPSTGTKDRVYTGMYLVPPGTITVGAEASAEIIYANEFVRLKEAGNHDLMKIFGGGDKADGFVNKFSKFVRQGLDQSASTKKLETAYQKNQSNAQGNTRGFGDKGMYGVRPFGGTLSKGITYFTWQENTGAEYYELQLIDSTSEDQVMMVLTRGPKLTLSTADVVLESGKTYYWEAIPVMPANTSKKRSLGGAAPVSTDPIRIHFTYSPQSLASLLVPLRASELYRKTTDPVQKKLLEAMELEENHFLYDAYKVYAKTLEENNNNLILRRTFAAFLARWNLRREAEELLHVD